MGSFLCSLCAVFAAVSAEPCRELRPLATLRQGAPVAFVTFSPDGKTLAAGGDYVSFAIILWDVETRKKLATLRMGSHSPEVAMSFAPDGKTLLLPTTDGTVEVWGIAARKMTHTVRFHINLFANNTSEVAISPNGKAFAVVGDGSCILLWDAGALKKIASYRDTVITSLAFSPNGKRLASINGNGEIQIWDVGTGGMLRRMKIGSGNAGDFLMSRLGFSADGKELACTGGDKKIAYFWDPETGHPIAEMGLPVPGFYSSSLAFSAAGELFAVGTVTDEKHKAVIYLFAGRGKEKRLVAVLRGHTSGAIDSVAFSPDGKMLASASDDGSIRLWSLGGDSGSAENTARK